MQDDCNYSRAHEFLASVEDGVAKRAAHVVLESAVMAIAGQRITADERVDLMFVTKLCHYVFSSDSNREYVVNGGQLKTGWEEVYEKLDGTLEPGC